MPFSDIKSHVTFLSHSKGEGVGYRGRLLMAVQAEMGDSASDAAIKQVEVEATAPISDVSSEAFSPFPVGSFTKF